MWGDNMADATIPEIPDFLNEDVDTIHKRMLDRAPSDINIIEGDLFWSLTRPVAEEEYRHRQLMAAFIKLVYLQSSYSGYLDLIGAQIGVIRKDAIKSKDTIKIKGKQGTVLESGKMAATVSSESNQSVEFQFLETKTIDDTGIAEIQVECTQSGTIGNVKANTITILTTPINGVQSVTNDHDFTNGTDVESDDDYKTRILEKLQTPATSGNKYQYRNWAKEVTGVGDAKPFPLWDGPGTVKVVIINSNKRAADAELVQKVKDYIDPQPEGHGEGQAPIGATLTVVSAVEKAIDITAKVVLANGYTIQQVQDNFNTNMQKYLSDQAFNSTYISYAKVGGILLSTDGVVDYNSLTLNGGTVNVALADEEIPVAGTISLGV
ncbi:Baseplate J-like protein [Clostridium luticellarii]|uniref:Baseplate J-like protein n=2 Tax=Clostridium luticellarii TaxID=1691940 RepID=A0A2T0BPZ9_9CLOT|nr:Baseplate J-like protein [Clostridium luticellarii]